MGQDKALLEWRGRPLILSIADLLRAITKDVAIVGPPERYAHLGLPVWPDRRTGCGPLAGIETALHQTSTARNLIVACDLPLLTLPLLEWLIATPGRCVVPRSPDGRLHPLCAVWEQSFAQDVTAALDRGVRRVRDLLDTENSVEVPVEGVWAAAGLDPAGPGMLWNANTPEEWEALIRE